MEFPIRCFTCGAPLGDLYEEYNNKLKEKKTPKEALDELGVNRYCCRRMFISYVEFETVKKYKKL